MKRIIIFTLVLFMSIPAIAIEVDVDEIRSPEIVFHNYQGTGHRADPVREINSIGLILARGAKKSGPDTLFRYHMKYSIYRAIGADEPEKLAADILSIDPDAGIDHIKNVRRILSSYLKAMYGYNDRQARAIALYATYYNALHRGDIDYLSGKYRKAVLSMITKDNAGISTTWNQWPGKTKILIPLKSGGRNHGTVDPFAISDRETSEAVRKDKNISDRREMIDIRKDAQKETQKTIDTRKNELEKKDEKLKQREKETAGKRDSLEKRKETVEKKKENLKKEEERARTITDPAKKRETENRISLDKKIIEKQEEQLKEETKKQAAEEKALEKEKEKTAGQKQDLHKQEKDLTEKKAETAEQEKNLNSDTKKQTAAAETPTSSSADTNKVIRQEEKKLDEREKKLDRREEKLRQEAREENLFASKLYYLKVMEYLEGGHFNNELFMIDPAKRAVLFRSPVTNICGSRYDIFSDGIVLITHRGSHTTGHRLTLVDRNTLKALKTGEDAVFWRSFIEIRDGYIYAITWDNGTHYLARFDRDLKMTAKSKEKVNRDTFITFFENYIYINREDRQVMILSKDTLDLVDVIKP